MSQTAFKTLPFITRMATMLSFYIAWVLFEELVIDRHGLDRFLPLYRVGNLCVYDLGIASVLAFTWFRLQRTTARA